MPPYVQRFCGDLEPSRGHGRRICKILRSECLRLYRDLLQARVFLQANQPAAKGKKWREYSRRIDHTVEALWRPRLRELRATQERNQGNQINAVHIDGDIQLPGYQKVEGHTITAQELQSDNWTPVLYKVYASRPARSPKPPHHSGIATSKAANPNASNAAQDAAAATGSGKAPARLPPATKETRLTVQRSKQLLPPPPNAIRVVVRLRGELRLLDVPTPRLMKAVQTQLRITLPDDFCVRDHPTNNTFTMATTHFPTAETVKTLTSLAIGAQTYRCAAYVAPPPGATRGVITNAYDDETPMQLYQDLVKRNPEYTILAALRIGKMYFILITFDINAVPHSIKYMEAIDRCTPYRGSPDTCTNCR
ncbi:hypothetical protein HPB49_004861 [Dermacentor silvarum]|uniref:Uncharacterized protein n=1 Tax=Dermacentor silvarum TaxID=543639 RepID=A0ACB8CVF8_DERSI|nr:hypothetical protein HPB49_004861 [Dermacentor silvarum]